jgi:hypothetical protein
MLCGVIASIYMFYAVVAIVLMIYFLADLI